MKPVHRGRQVQQFRLAFGAEGRVLMATAAQSGPAGLGVCQKVGVTHAIVYAKDVSAGLFRNTGHAGHRPFTPVAVLAAHFGACRSHDTGLRETVPGFGVKRFDREEGIGIEAALVGVGDHGDEIGGERLRPFSRRHSPL